MSRGVVMATWDDVPHLDEATKKELYDSYPPHMRDARTKGIPQFGAGAVFPIAEDKLKIDDFALPPYWPRAYALDVGWNRTAACWGAWDQQSDVVYLYSHHYQGQEEPVVHAKAIKSRGVWIPGVIDPAARGRSQRDGQKLVNDYIHEGLNLFYAENTVESGLLDVWQRMTTGRLRVFRTLTHWFEEYRLYRRDEKGKLVGEDHLMDCTRYLIVSGLAVATTEAIATYEPDDSDEFFADESRNKSTGY